MVFFLIPAISVTPPEDELTLSTSPYPSSSYSHSTAHTALEVPPLACMQADRLSLIQRGIPVGSFRLNCAVPPSPPASSQRKAGPAADISTTRKLFNWGASKMEGMGGNGRTGAGIVGGRTAAGRHNRARSLNCVQDFGEQMQAIMPKPPSPSIPSPQRTNNSYHSAPNRTFSIDLSAIPLPF